VTFIPSDSEDLMMSCSVRVSDNRVVRWSIAQAIFFHQNAIQASLQQLCILIEQMDDGKTSEKMDFSIIAKTTPL